MIKNIAIALISILLTLTLMLMALKVKESIEYKEWIKEHSQVCKCPPT